MSLIRAANRDELDQILALDRRCSPVFSQAEAYARLVGAGGPLLVVVDAGTVFAFAAFFVVRDEATLLNLAVAPEHRRQGHGRALLEHAFELLTDAGVRRVLLELRESNAPARGLYRALGFSEDGVREAYYPGVAGGDRENALLLSVQLEANRAGS